MYQLYDTLTNDQLVDLLLEQIDAAEQKVPPGESQELADVIDLQAFKEQRTRHARAC
ncbi:MAG TPA: hypothetical protein H9884_06275 [Candidatus Yaniella excrementigallinarum]|nr:hypothetical protein [Candidatus Yaniella excrementigallinarum]